MDRKTIIIKKYENRRLYDTTNSRYVNLDEVAQTIRDGSDVQVVDAVTGEDLTRLVLTQIIVEHAKAADSAFPLDLLRQMVIASGRATQETALKYMKAVFDMYQNAYRAMSPPLSPFEFIPQPPAPRPATAEVPPGTRSTGNGRESRAAERGGNRAFEVEALRRRVEELESLVSDLGAKKASRKGKTRPHRRS